MSITQRFAQMPPVTKNLLIINVIIYIFMALLPRWGYTLEQYGALYYFTSDQFRPWQLVSYMFIHANFWHLFFNMFSLWMFGEIIERSLRSDRFLFYYLSCGIGAALIQEGIFALMVNHYASMYENGAEICRLLRHSNVTVGELLNLNVYHTDPAIQSIAGLYHTPTVGASGAIYGVLLAFGFMFPYQRIMLLIPPVPLKARTAVIIFAVIELALGVYNSQADTVAHFAHLGGMIVGLLILLWWRKNGTIARYYF